MCKDKDENNEVLRLLVRLNEAHGGTVIAHSKALYSIKNDLLRMERRLYRIEKRQVED